MSLFLSRCYLAGRDGMPTAAYNGATGQLDGVLTGFAIVPIEDYERLAADVQRHAQERGFGQWQPPSGQPRQPSIVPGGSYPVEGI